MGLSVDGLSSGLDTTSLISKLIEIEKAPIRLKESRQNEYEAKLNAWSDLSSSLSALQTAAESMSSRADVGGLSTLFENSNVLATNTVLTATTSSSATSGTFTIDVISLATSEKEVAQGFTSSSSSIGDSDGTITIGLGTVTTYIDIDSSNNTLEGIKLAINNAGVGVTATIINDGSSNPYRLVVTSNDTGTSNTISITDTLSVGGALTFTETQAASDAEFTLDGINITKEDNAVTDVIEGVTINLKSVGAGTLSFETDTDKVKEDISAFVDAYNDVLSYIDQQFEYDADNEARGGPLFGNGTLLSIQSKLRGIVSSGVEHLTGDYTSLSQIGIRTGEDGRLAIDDSQLSDALRDDVGGVVDLFAAASTVTDSRISYVSKTNDTDGGDYELQMDGGVLQIRETGSSTWADMSGFGNFWTAESGSAEGLMVKLNNQGDGSYGTLVLSRGVADHVATEVDFLTDKSYQGMIYAEEEDARQSIEDLTSQIEDLEYRIGEKEAQLKTEFANLEVLLGQMQSEQDYLTAQLANL